MRKETVNTFEKGLNTDTTPINASKQMLTDCVNGTLLTYNGNEYTLQNDMGNYKLAHSKLPDNYMPVGTTEYGDILYIVAYNPLTKNVQVGSFPSPQRITETTPDMERDLQSILTRWFSTTSDTEETYNNLIENYQEMQVFYSGDDTYKIYPGDGYRIDNQPTTTRPHEKLHYYIMDDNKKLYDITDQVKTGEDCYATWQVPGYLALQWELPKITSFNIKPRSVIPDDTTCKVDINFQIESDDPLLQEAYDASDLQVKIETVEEPVVSNDIDVYGVQTYYNANLKSGPTMTAEKTIDEEGNEDKVLTINAYPQIKTDGRLISYKQFQSSLSLSLNDLLSAKNTFIASDYYTYHVNGTTVTLNFNINAPVITAGEVSLKIYAKPLSECLSIDDLTKVEDWQVVTEDGVYDGVGQQIIQIELPDTDGYGPENVYVLKFELTDTVTTIDSYKLLIASELMNDFSKEQYPFFDQIPITEWSSRICELDCSDIDLSWDSEPVCSGPYTDGIEGADDKFWLADRSIGNGFFPEESDHLTKIDSFKRGYTFTVDALHMTGKMAQKYLYNFCTIQYTEDSILDLEGTDTSIHLNELLTSTGEIDMTVNGVDGAGVPVNVYVQKKYVTDPSFEAEALDTDYMEPLTNTTKELWEWVDVERDVLDDDYIDPSTGRPANSWTHKETYKVKIPKNVCDHWVGLYIEDSTKNNSAYTIKSSYMTVVPNPEPEHDWIEDKYMATGRGAVLKEKHYAAKNAVKVGIDSNVFAKTVKNAFKEWNTCAALCCIDINKKDAAKYTGLAKYSYDDYIGLDKRGFMTLLGIVLLQQGAPVFIPLDKFGQEFEKKDYNRENFSPFRWPDNATMAKLWNDENVSDKGTCYCYDEDSDHQVARQSLKRFLRTFKVNRKKYANFVKGAFLQKSSDEVSVHDWATLTGNVTAKPLTIKLLNSNTDLTQGRLLINDTKNLVFGNFEGIINYNEGAEYTVEMNNRNQPFKGFDTNTWPYRMPDGVEETDDMSRMTIAGLDQRMELLNSYIEKKAEEFFDSEFYLRVQEGRSLGFYFNEDSGENLEDWKTIYDFINNDINDSDYNRSLMQQYEVGANCGREDAIFWVFSDEHNDIEKGELSFDDGSDNPKDPRQPIFYCDNYVEWPALEVGDISEEEETEWVDPFDTLECAGDWGHIEMNYSEDKPAKKPENNDNWDDKEDDYTTTIVVGKGEDIGKINGHYSPSGKPILYVLELNDYKDTPYYTHLKEEAFKGTQRTYHYAVQLSEADARKLKNGSLTYSWTAVFAEPDSLIVTGPTTAYQNLKDNRYISFFPGVEYRTTEGTIRAQFDLTSLMRYTGPIKVGKGADYGKINGQYSDTPTLWDLDTGKPISTTTATVEAAAKLGSVRHFAMQLPADYDGNKQWYNVNASGYNQLEWRGWLEDENSAAASILVSSKYATGSVGIDYALYSNRRGVKIVLTKTDPEPKPEPQPPTPEGEELIINIDQSTESITLKKGETAKLNIDYWMAPHPTIEVVDPTVVEFNLLFTARAITGVKVGTTEMRIDNKVVEVQVVDNQSIVELEDIQLYYNGKVAPSKFTVPKGQIFKVYGYLTPSNATSNVIEFSKRVGDQFYGKGVVGNCFSILAENGSTYLYLYGVKSNGEQIRKQYFITAE